MSKKLVNVEEHSVLVIGALTVDVIRKDIKNLHISVMPPCGKVRVAVPAHINTDRIRTAIVSKLPWIKKQQADFENQPRQSEREMVSGESHYFLGRRYLLEVIEKSGKHSLSIKGNNKLIMQVNKHTSKENRLKLLDSWYRNKLKKMLPNLLDNWEAIIGVSVTACGIKKMKTKWGSCNIQDRRIWLNLELAKKPPECLEYIIVHELVHLLERKHNAKFKAYMDKFLPIWSESRNTLSSSPLAHGNWQY